MVDRRNDSESSENEAKQNNLGGKTSQDFLGFLGWIWKSIAGVPNTSNKYSDGHISDVDGDKEIKMAKPEAKAKDQKARKNNGCTHAENMNRIKYIKANNRLKNDSLLRLAVYVLENNQEKIDYEKVNAAKEKEPSAAENELLVAIENGDKDLQRKKASQLLIDEEKRIFSLLSQPHNVRTPRLSKSLTASKKENGTPKTADEISKLLFSQTPAPEYVYPEDQYITPLFLGLETDIHPRVASQENNSQNSQAIQSKVAHGSDAAAEQTMKEDTSKK
ncbi:MAG: hypothetical protein KAG53_00055 [Endozoicomonadaceae bacterium]|nr:hypothetical protein [Endozoicomonadaceae bacterium]